MKDKLITIQELSQISSIKVSTLRAATFKRQIPYVKIGRLVRFRLKDLEEFIQNNTLVPIKKE